ncbi:MAG: 2,3-bisphosphoglycerate-independent phosphoglycerate mutase [Solirubrobacteraceae bacterium]
MSDLLDGAPHTPPVPSVCLVVLDGWGLAPPGPGNAVALAHTPVFDELWAGCPHTTLNASGHAVGLPEGQMGNSEVGHLNLGAGAVVKQDLVRIDQAVAAGALAHNPAIARALHGARRVHLLGLVSDGGVHSSLGHLFALVDVAAQLAPHAHVFIHAFTDGRDTLPHAGESFLQKLDALPHATLASVVGRYWAMDRDRRWDRTQRAYDLLVHGQAPHAASSGVQAVRDAYRRGETDEFIEPTLVSHHARIGPRDSVICFNFRPDRMRQIVTALAQPRFGDDGEELPGWEGRRGAAPVAQLTTLTQYQEDSSYPVAFAPHRPSVTLAQVLAQTGGAQLHVAETEKYAHVTYFFNGGREAPLARERRELVPSPRDVPTYDRKPQMSAKQAADAFVRGWTADSPRLGVVNFANADMVGHTGVIPAAVAAVETVDSCLGQVVRAVHAGGGACIVTADHGNSDHMLQPDGSPNTAHSLNPVPLIVTARGVALHAGEGILADVAPTVLALLGIPQPAQMTGRSLLDRGV